jgi:hypothetical protein
MNTKSSAWTGRAPRSMAEAFNPYTSNDLQPMREPRGRHAQDWALYVVAVIGLAVVVGVVL